MDKIPSTTRISRPHPALPVAASTMGRQRRMQYKAVFKRNPENMADTGAGAWLWASGSQL